MRLKKKKISSTSGTYKISFLTGKNKIGDSAPTTGSVLLCFFCFGAFLVLSQGVDGFAKSGAINLNALGITLVVQFSKANLWAQQFNKEKKDRSKLCTVFNEVSSAHSDSCSLKTPEHQRTNVHKRTAV